MPDERLLKSYVWHCGNCFLVSTIERAALGSSRYHETMAWEYNWATSNRGELVAHVVDGPALRQHFSVMEQLFRNGRMSDE